VNVLPVWSVGDVLRFGGDFNKYVTARSLTKQEGIVFRHLLRMILLCGEFAEVTPNGADADELRAELREIAARLTETCREVDPESTDKAIESAHAADVVEGEATTRVEATETIQASDFGAGVLDGES
ncbi:MAG: DEAD/DEAH box helicase, partial [Planctomycetaceae bacterium]